MPCFFKDMFISQCWFFQLFVSFADFPKIFVKFISMKLFQLSNKNTFTSSRLEMFYKSCTSFVKFFRTPIH